MKTTIELDEGKLDRIMKLTGIGTMKEAVDWALSGRLHRSDAGRAGSAASAHASSPGGSAL